ncbi:MAG TPA: M23 family metallopeptidase [Candidatus Eisenbacteria bacterium]|nr:M23 family metallopeptidase [Candidatus Eisenbacteria bacterium]
MKTPKRESAFNPFLAWLTLPCLLLAAGGRPGAAASVTVSSPVVYQGELFELRVSGIELIELKARLGNDSMIFQPEGNRVYVALGGADLEAKPGPARLVIVGKTSSGAELRHERNLEIKSREFPREELSVPGVFDQLTEATLQRIRRERERLERVFMTPVQQRLWDGPFMPPVTGVVTAPFGYRRIVNGIPRAPHGGADLRAPLGTPVLAPNHGRVRLLDEFFFSGKSLVLDHGAGLFTMYFHLADFNVHDGAIVRKGDIIARSGMSGRVTGPHLHWGARLNGARIDPFQLIEKLGPVHRPLPEAAVAPDLMEAR